MWGLFKGNPTCPVDADLREWMDGRFGWLQEQLGHDTPRKVRVILPTPEFFPDPFQGRVEDLQHLFLRVAGYMKVDPNRFKVFVYSEANGVPPTMGDRHTTGTAGVYQRNAGVDQHGQPLAAIGIEASQLADPLSLVATLAHEIGHEILLGQKRIGADAQDHEPLTDLLTVFMGMGIFTANATIRDRGWSNGAWAGWQTKRLGYLDQRMFGYALARFAWTRSELRPAWMKHVRGCESAAEDGIAIFGEV